LRCLDEAPESPPNVGAIGDRGKLMFGRTIPSLADFDGTATLDARAVFMVDRMAEREGFEPSLGF
jgi:hypothetical protein